MRNLKRALSLTLASVMLLGMMVIGTSAAAGYSDVDEDDNVEAIEVLQAIEVMVGDDRGFGPDRPVNRAEMAVVMGLLLNLDYNYYVSTCPFADVSGNYEWARGWVGACAANGIVSGRGEGIYDPGATVTAIEAASMMMRALGYFQNAEDYNDGFVLVTVRQGNQIGIFNGVGSDGSTPMTRNQVAQMALNALRSEIVDFTGTPGIEVNGVKVGYRAEYTSRTSTEKKYNAIEGRTSDVASDANHKGQYYVQLGEELYNGDLRLNNNDRDAFQRPSRTWEYKGEQIGTYMKKELLDKEYTTKVTGRDLYDELSRNTIETYEFVIAVDGEELKETLEKGDNAYFTKGNLVRTNTNAVGATDKGVLTQVFVDNNSEDPTVYICVINTYLAKASKDYDDKKEEATFTVYGVEDIDTKNPIVLVKNTADKDSNKSGKQPYTESLVVRNEDINVEDVKDGDIVLVNVAEGEIKVIADPETLADQTISAFKRGSWVNNGSQIDYADTALYDPEVLEEYDQTNMKDVTYDIYLDAYGYMIGLKQNSDPDQYVFITGMDGNNTNLKNRTFDVNAIFMDGRMETITVNGKDSVWTADTKEGTGIMNTWCKYSVNSSDVYTLTEVGESIIDEKAAQTAFNVNPGGSREVNRKNLSVKTEYAAGTAGEFTTVYGNDDTVFLTVSLDVIEGQYEYAQQTTANDQDRSIANRWVNGTTNEKTVAIIDDVDSVAVGVENVSIEVKDVVFGDYKDSAGNAYTNTTLVIPKHEIYALYNDDGYIIASVVIGDDAGSTKSYAYITSGNVNREGYTSADEEWTWTREAVINGEIGELTYKGSSLRYIGNGSTNGNMKSGEWYEVRYDANGNVRRADKLTFAPYSSTNTKYINRVEDVEAAINNGDTVILQVLLNNANDKLTLDGGTLYTDAQKTDTKGFWVARDVKTVLGLSKLLVTGNEGGVEGTDIAHLDDVTDGYEGRTGLESAIDDLDKNFNGYLNVLFDSTGAVTIILDDHWGTKVDEGNTVVTTGKYSSEVDQTITTGLSDLDLSVAANNQVDGSGKLKLNTYGGGNEAKQIQDALANLGYTNVSIKLAGGKNYTITASNKNGVEETITCDNTTDITKYWIVDNNGAKSYVDNSSTVTIAAIAGSTGFQAQEADGTKTYVAYGSNHTVTQDVTLEPGYVSVAAATNYNGNAGGVTSASFALKDSTLSTSGVKPGATLEYVITYSGTATAAVTITFTAGANSTAVAPNTVSIANGTVVAAGTTATFSATVSTDDVAAATVAIA